MGQCTSLCFCPTEYIENRLFVFFQTMGLSSHSEHARILEVHDEFRMIMIMLVQEFPLEKGKVLSVLEYGCYSNRPSVKCYFILNLSIIKDI